MSRTVASFMCMVALLTAIGAPAFAGLPEVGRMAPQFTLKSQEESNVRLSDFKGKWVVLYFYPKDFTSGCTLEAHNFQRDLASYEKMNAAILGVSLDDVGSHRSFCEQEGLHFKLLADVGHKVSELYGSLREYQGKPVAARNTFIINPKGQIARVFEGVNPAHHSEEVLAALKELQSR